jgi:hypothetical protein
MTTALIHQRHLSRIEQAYTSFKGSTPFSILKTNQNDVEAIRDSNIDYQIQKGPGERDSTYPASIDRTVEWMWRDIVHDQTLCRGAPPC